MGQDSLLTFPCSYVLKIVTTTEVNLTRLLAMIKPHVPEIVETDITVKTSREAKYVSFSLHFKAQSQQQLDALYRDLTAQKEVVFVL